MKRLSVVLSPRASHQLADLRNYIETDSGAARANSFVDAIVDYCGGIAVFPKRGTKRDDLLAGLRVIGCRRRATIVFTIEPQGVVIQGVFYGGQDYEAALREPP